MNKHNQNTDVKILPIILSGGSGTRLWPLSSNSFPKQFNNEVVNPTLFSKAINLVNTPEFLPPIIITNKKYEHLLWEVLVTTQTTAVILEPSSRSTAPAILACALWVEKHLGSNITMLILPSDHLISSQSQFIQSIQNGIERAKTHIVTFGVKPIDINTEYGYVEIEEADSESNHAFKVRSFKEKPTKKIAEKLIRNDNVYWNCGIFLFNSAGYINLCKEYIPQTHNYITDAITNATVNGNIVNLSDDFSKADLESIDYAILQPASTSKKPKDNIYLCKMFSNWCDVGNFESLQNNSQKNSQNNTIRGNVRAMETHNCFLHNNTNRLLTAFGLQNTVVVQTDSITLVSPLENSQGVKKLVESLKLNEVNANIIQRLWGSYEIIAQMAYFKVKKLIVKTGKCISLQSHEHRSETWVVVKGQATVLCNNATLLLNEGESVSIPAKARHQLRNETENDLEIIEVQTGAYLEEDDIIRYEAKL